MTMFKIFLSFLVITQAVRPQSDTEEEIGNFEEIDSFEEGSPAVVLNVMMNANSDIEDEEARAGEVQKVLTEKQADLNKKEAQASEAAEKLRRDESVLQETVARLTEAKEKQVKNEKFSVDAAMKWQKAAMEQAAQDKQVQALQTKYLTTKTEMDNDIKKLTEILKTKSDEQKSKQSLLIQAKAVAQFESINAEATGKTNKAARDASAKAETARRQAETALAEASSQTQQATAKAKQAMEVQSIQNIKYDTVAQELEQMKRTKSNLELLKTTINDLYSSIDNLDTKMASWRAKNPKDLGKQRTTLVTDYKSDLKKVLQANNGFTKAQQTLLESDHELYMQLREKGALRQVVDDSGHVIAQSCDLLKWREAVKEEKEAAGKKSEGEAAMPAMKALKDSCGKKLYAEVGEEQLKLRDVMMPGERVKIISSKKIGTVKTPQDEQDKFMVDVGAEKWEEVTNTQVTRVVMKKGSGDCDCNCR